VHEWLVNYAGSERCVESFTNIFKDADIFTLVDFLSPEEKSIIVKDKIPSTSFIQKLPGAKNNFRNYLPLFPLAIEQFNLSEYDLIISSSHAVAKGALTNSNQLHICYCHTPIRYAWNLYHQYLKESNLTKGIKGTIAKLILHYIRIWDSASVNRVDYFIANSKYIARRIKKIYGKDAVVIYPPVDTDKFPCETNKDDYYLAASRFVPYKKIDLIAATFSKMPNKKLIIIGDGPDIKKVRSLVAGYSNIELLGYQTEDKLKKYIQHAKAFVFAAEEDFGIMNVEALSCGTPVIAFNKGGASETITDNKTGILFNSQTVDAVINAINRFEADPSLFNPKELNNFAKQFDRKIFEKKFSDFVNNKCSEFFNK